MHTPVLLQECLKWLSPENEPFADNALMIDSTLGEGGHTNAFLSTYKNLRVIGLDADASIQKRAKERLAPFGERIHFYNTWFNDFYANYPENEAHPDIILFDLGISVFHYERSGRGLPYILHRRSRAEMAVNVGADIVVEGPPMGIMGSGQYSLCLCKMFQALNTDYIPRGYKPFDGIDDTLNRISLGHGI